MELPPQNRHVSTASSTASSSREETQTELALRCHLNSKVVTLPSLLCPAASSILFDVLLQTRSASSLSRVLCSGDESKALSSPEDEMLL